LGPEGRKVKYYWTKNCVLRKDWVEHVARVGKRTGKCKDLGGVGGNVGKRSLERPGRRWKDNVKIHFQEVERDDSGLHSYGTGLRRVASFCNHGDEYYVS